jgi:hypothetical protein
MTSREPRVTLGRPPRGGGKATLSHAKSLAAKSRNYRAKRRGAHAAKTTRWREIGSHARIRRTRESDRISTQHGGQRSPSTHAGRTGPPADAERFPVPRVPGSLKNLLGTDGLRRSQDGPITRRLRGSTSQSETRLIRDMGPEGLIDRGRPPVQEIRATTVAVPKSSPAVKTEVCKVASSAPAAAAVRSAWTPLTTTS